MKYTALVFGGSLVFGLVACGAAAAQTAKAELRNAEGKVVGRATLTEEAQGVKIAVEVFGLPFGPRGFHIHAVGKCDPPGFTSAGGHFNPHGKKHGLRSPEGPHAGDLPNMVVWPDGTAKFEVVAPHVTLGAGTHSLFHPGGTALVIHADVDDERTDPTGNAGGRIACGVITK